MKTLFFVNSNLVLQYGHYLKRGPMQFPTFIRFIGFKLMYCNSWQFSKYQLCPVTRKSQKNWFLSQVNILPRIYSKYCKISYLFFLHYNILWTTDNSKYDEIVYQGFIQAILMSSRQYKKLNLLIEYWNSIFIKFYFWAHQNKLAYYVLFYFKLLFTLQM